MIGLNKNSQSLMEKYSLIISPQDYNRIVTEEHLYIKAADKYIEKIIEEYTSSINKAEVVELGCGPGRILQNMAKIRNISLTGVDIDSEFLEYAKTIINNPEVKYNCTSIQNYKHSRPVDIFYSQGFHHHIEKGKKTQQYLKSIYQQLKPGGIYIIGDEFIPDYQNEQERAIKLVIWYSHIINNAMKKKYNFLAQEEAKTLLDDLQEGDLNFGYKNEDQIEFTLSAVSAIDKAAMSNNSELVNSLANKYLEKLGLLFNSNKTGDEKIDLSRRDYKICDRIFSQEISEVGFKIKHSKVFGPINNIGAMVVYILYK